jgi:hypothetical protein
LNGALPRLLRAGLLTGVVDFLFASALSVFAYGSTFSRLWQGVASVPLGRQALEGGTPMVAAGILIHFGVAFAWSAVFVFLVLRSPWVRRVLASPFGVAKVPLVYGPLIWLVMSTLVIPPFTGRMPTINARWWIQLLGHVPFVALPIVAASRPRPAAVPPR